MTRRKRKIKSKMACVYVTYQNHDRSISGERDENIKRKRSFISLSLSSLTVLLIIFHPPHWVTLECVTCSELRAKWLFLSRRGPREWVVGWVDWGEWNHFLPGAPVKFFYLFNKKKRRFTFVSRKKSFIFFHLKYSRTAHTQRTFKGVLLSKCCVTLPLAVI